MAGISSIKNNSIFENKTPQSSIILSNTPIIIGSGSYFFMLMSYLSIPKNFILIIKMLLIFLTNFWIFALITSFLKKKKCIVFLVIVICALASKSRLYASGKIEIERNSASFCAKSLNLLIKHKPIILKNFWKHSKTGTKAKMKIPINFANHMLRS